MVDTQLRVYTHPRRSIIMGKRRRTYTPEFKAEAVRLVTEQGYSVAEAARSLGLHETLLRSWKQALEAQGEQAFPGHGKLPAVEEELRRLRAENKRLLMERDILKKAAAFFAREAT
jgi:transposase